MVKRITVTFDGRTFVPEEKVEVPINSKHHLDLEVPEENAPVRHKWMQIAADAKLQGPEDLSANMHKYMYGEKRGEY